MKQKFALTAAFVLTLFSVVPPGISAPDSKQSAKKTSKKIRSEAGLNIPSWGIAIDAVYDSRLDELLPGYKIVNVVLTNRGAADIRLDAAKDDWRILDQLGKSHTATNHLRQRNEKMWADLPQGLKEKLDYPNLVRIGKSAQIDLFFPDDIELFNFREIVWRSSHFKKEFSVYTVTDKDVDSHPSPSIEATSSAKQSNHKYDGDLSEAAQEARQNNEEPKKTIEPFSIPVR